ncbi:actin-related protein 6-like [Saccoglossus kowalevskii]|uniref:Actin-related protein 6-like n=1 Tax=Saccoglossus kowalevskii TaxID=10224 RepID=A0ABM0GQ12_SACKO|nr:PREDICTED: actin-related protein 6-like [Saccoglossus kowalevskii]
MAAIVLDNGAYTAKVGYASEKEPKKIPNCLMKAKSERRKQFIGNQIDECKDLSGLFYVLPMQKGYLINWDVQRQVWDNIFGKDVLNAKCSEHSIIIGEPYFNFSSIQEAMNEIFFEEYQFNSLCRMNVGTLSAHKAKDDNKTHLCCLVIDSGYSFTHITPYYNCEKIEKGIKRINVGGKILTNHLKEIISYRQLHVMDETYVINQVKEDVCFVSNQFYKDMNITQLKGKDNTIVKDYVLPDFSQIKRGYVKEESSGKAKQNEQIVRMNNERFSVPEILFHPSDIGIQEMGIPEAVILAINATPKEMHPHLYRNIVLTGGNSLFPGYRQRVFDEVRSLAPQEYEVNVVLPQNAITYPWEGGGVISKYEEFQDKYCVTKKQYEESGQNICLETFDV